eukprot:30802-Pelagococcus_subviridis.AAC.10
MHRRHRDLRGRPAARHRRGRDEIVHVHHGEVVKAHRRVDVDGDARRAGVIELERARDFENRRLRGTGGVSHRGLDHRRVHLGGGVAVERRDDGRHRVRARLRAEVRADDDGVGRGGCRRRRLRRRRLAPRRRQFLLCRLFVAVRLVVPGAELGEARALRQRQRPAHLHPVRELFEIVRGGELEVARPLRAVPLLVPAQGDARAFDDELVILADRDGDVAHASDDVHHGFARVLDVALRVPVHGHRHLGHPRELHRNFTRQRVHRVRRGVRGGLEIFGRHSGLLPEVRDEAADARRRAERRRARGRGRGRGRAAVATDAQTRVQRRLDVLVLEHDRGDDPVHPQLRVEIEAESQRRGCVRDLSFEFPDVLRRAVDELPLDFDVEVTNQHVRDDLDRVRALASLRGVVAADVRDERERRELRPDARAVVHKLRANVLDVDAPEANRELRVHVLRLV